MKIGGCLLDKEASQRCLGRSQPWRMLDQQKLRGAPSPLTKLARTVRHGEKLLHPVVQEKDSDRSLVIVDKPLVSNNTRDLQVRGPCWRILSERRNGLSRSEEMSPMGIKH